MPTTHTELIFQGKTALEYVTSIAREFCEGADLETYRTILVERITYHTSRNQELVAEQRRITAFSSNEWINLYNKIVTKQRTDVEVWNKQNDTNIRLLHQMQQQLETWQPKNNGLKVLALHQISEELERLINREPYYCVTYPFSEWRKTYATDIAATIATNDAKITQLNQDFKELDQLIADLNMLNKIKG
jgi:hypothetical protein